MDGSTIGTLAQYIAELRRRDRKDNGAARQPSFDTTLVQDLDGDEGNRSGNGRCDSNDPGQSRDSIR